MPRPSHDGRAAVGSAVRVQRADRNWTQEELARYAGVNVDTVSDLEAGNTWPRTKTLRAIEKALGWPSGKLDQIAAEGGIPEIAAEDDWEAAILGDPNLTDREKREIIQRSRRVRAELYPGVTLRRPPAHPERPAADRKSEAG